MDWVEGEIRWIAVETIGESYRRYRLPDAAAEAAMAGSLSRYGQISPVAVCLREERPELLDGFKRLTATKTIPGVLSLQARLLEVDDRVAKAIILGLNGIGCRMKELEEAWIVHALVREDGLSQLEVAELLGRHKSWVCRRLAILERLSEECREDLRLGLLSPTVARQLTRLPAGNQIEVVTVARREHLTTAEIHAVVDLIVACSSRPQMEFILEQPSSSTPWAYRALPPGSRRAQTPAAPLQLRHAAGYVVGAMADSWIGFATTPYCRRYRNWRTTTPTGVWRIGSGRSLKRDSDVAAPTLTIRTN